MLNCDVLNNSEFAHCAFMPCQKVSRPNTNYTILVFTFHYFGLVLIQPGVTSERKQNSPYPSPYISSKYHFQTSRIQSYTVTRNHGGNLRRILSFKRSDQYGEASRNYKYSADPFLCTTAKSSGSD
jgi:hypothetical protein